MSYVELQFKPQCNEVDAQHREELRNAQFRARQTCNAATLLPAEAACYMAHASALVITRAKCLADAYTAFNEPADQEAVKDLESFFLGTVGGRKASFQGEVELRQLRTRQDAPQLGGLLRNFDRGVNPALEEGRAILARQKVELNNRPKVLATKYVVDTCVFNWLADGWLAKDALPKDGGFAITHVQVDEINKTQDEERRARLFLTMYTSLRCDLLPTQTFVFDVSRFDHAKWGDGKLCSSLKAELDTMNGSKKSNVRDALIAEVAIANRYILLTADGDLKLVTENHGGAVIFFPHPSQKNSSD